MSGKKRQRKSESVADAIEAAVERLTDTIVRINDKDEFDVVNLGEAIHKMDVNIECQLESIDKTLLLIANELAKSRKIARKRLRQSKRKTNNTDDVSGSDASSEYNIN